MKTSEAVYFTGPRKAEVRDFALPDLGPKDVLVETLASAISAGTELSVYRGLAPQWRKRQDPETLLFVDADHPDWEYPSRYGYAMVGHVRQVGGDVADRRTGQLVFAYAPHGRHAVLPAALTVPLDDGVEPETGVFFANLNTAYNGVLDARPPLGACVVVSGLGVIGQLLIRLLARTGPSSLVAVDPISARRELAIKGGASDTLDPGKGSVAEVVRGLTGGRGADAVIEVSGAATALNEAIRCAGYNGQVVAMSWYTGAVEGLDLSGEFHHNRIRITSSQVGMVSPDLGPLWTVARRKAYAGHLLRELGLAALVTHRMPFERAPEAYALLDEHPADVMQVVLTY